jgi:hypothetical protein
MMGLVWGYGVLAQVNSFEGLLPIPGTKCTEKGKRGLKLFNIQVAKHSIKITSPFS